MAKITPDPIDIDGYVGMAEKGHVQFLRRLVVGIENRVVESSRSQVRDELSGFEAQLLYAAPELVRHFIGTTCGGGIKGARRLFFSLKCR